MEKKESSKPAQKKKMTHSEKIERALKIVEQSKQKLERLTENRILEIGKMASKYDLLDVDNSVFEAAFQKIKNDLKKS